jgi:Zn-dependent M28 family amino/carboxypeptidase
LKEEYIICSAHYDHLGIGRQDSEGDSIYNGARDNAIGVMSVLMAAENIARHPLKRSVIFVLFTGEEKGLLGSKWMSNHPPVDLGDIVFCLNSDGGGYNDTTIVTIIGARRINTYDVFDKACEVVNLIAFDGTDAAQSLFNSSDNIVFAQKGIPALTFSTGFRDMDTEIMKYYHQPSDEAETIDYNYLEKFSLAFGISLREIADSNDRFFWNDDDEFFPIGKKLYEK